MANVEDKYPDNVEGSYYVDESCIACGLCVNDAPDNFVMADDDSYAYVYKQPEDDTEEEACEKAMADCPVDAIGDDN